jgi:DUF1680 family protein
MGERVYAHNDRGIWTVLYIDSTATVALPAGDVRLTQRTGYPWHGNVAITVDVAKPIAFDLHLRIPGWCREKTTVSVNGAAVALAKPEKGYVCLRRAWQAGDRVTLDIPMQVERIHAHSAVLADIGRVTLQRGPVVYCLEGVDNNGRLRDLCLPPTCRCTAQFEKDLLGGVVVIRGEGLSVSRDTAGKLVSQPLPFQAIPYCVWDNRGAGPMEVWVPEQPEFAAESNTSG